jgi:SAD/SRA domain
MGEPKLPDGVREHARGDGWDDPRLQSFLRGLRGEADKEATSDDSRFQAFLKALRGADAGKDARAADRNSTATAETDTTTNLHDNFPIPATSKPHPETNSGPVEPMASSTMSRAGPMSPKPLTIQTNVSTRKRSRNESVSPGTADAHQQVRSQGTTPISPSIPKGPKKAKTESIVSPTNAFTNIPKAKKNQGPLAQDSITSTASPTSLATSKPRAPPQWYNQIDLRKLDSRKLDQRLMSRLQTIRNYIEDAQKVWAAQCQPALDAIIPKIRNELHDLEYLKVDAKVIRVKRLLENEKGLPQLFDPDFTKGVPYPWDIAADAELVYNKWCQEFFDPDMLRGIKAPPKSIIKNEPKAAWSFEKNYGLKKDAHYHGNKYLVNGQWWPRQICAVRDGAHGASVAGITGPSPDEPGKGAVSCVMSGETYAAVNKDGGDEVLYAGTEQDDPKHVGQPTPATRHMMDAVKSKLPVRLMRSANLPADNNFRPKEGFRYDGLYTVLGMELLDKDKAHYRFHLKRCPGQPPIRSSGVEERPTARELAEWQKIKRQLGIAGKFD